MKNVFKRVKAKCKVCGQVLYGDNIKRRGDFYYCDTDFEKTSPEEIQQHSLQKLRKKNYDKIFKR